MQVRVEFTGQLKQRLQQSQEMFDVNEGCQVKHLIEKVAQEKGDDFRSVMMNEKGELRPTLLICVNEKQISPPWEAALFEGDVVALLSPISGG